MLAVVAVHDGVLAVGAKETVAECAGPALGALSAQALGALSATFCGADCEMVKVTRRLDGGRREMVSTRTPDVISVDGPAAQRIIDALQAWGVVDNDSTGADPTINGGT
ncbi:MAG: hypothetical protein ABIQ39_13420 [Ilumatobacteraceae bacterium]